MKSTETWVLFGSAIVGAILCWYFAMVLWRAFTEANDDGNDQDSCA